MEGLPIANGISAALAHRERGCLLSECLTSNPFI